MKVVVVLPAYNCAKSLKNISPSLTQKKFSDFFLGGVNLGEEALYQQNVQIIGKIESYSTLPYRPYDYCAK